jgi:hypothetical protein
MAGCSGGDDTSANDAGLVADNDAAGEEAAPADAPVSDVAQHLCDPIVPDDGSSCPLPRRLGTPYGCPDRHCRNSDDAPIALPVNTVLCAMPSDGGTIEGGTGTVPASPAAIELDDDECKFHVKMATMCAGGASDRTFTFELTQLIDGALAAGAAPYIDAYLSLTHFAPDLGVGAEIGPGVYTISPVRFDASGIWTVVFHIYSGCPLGTASAHAHWTALVEVP